MVKSSSQKSIAMDTLSCTSPRGAARRCVCVSQLTAWSVPLPWRAKRDAWERAAARAGGVAAEHGAGWATPLKTAQHEASARIIGGGRGRIQLFGVGRAWSGSASSKIARVVVRASWFAVAAAGAGTIARVRAPRRCAPSSSGWRAGATSRARKGGSIIGTAIESIALGGAPA